jgi:hypothetical protein
MRCSHDVFSVLTSLLFDYAANVAREGLDVLFFTSRARLEKVPTLRANSNVSDAALTRIRIKYASR